MIYKSLYRLLLVSVILLTIVDPRSVRAQSSSGPIDPQELEIFFDGLITAQMQAARIPGVTLAVVANGEVLLAKGYGYADVGKQIPVVAETTLFRPGSVSKLFTWTAVMQLVEQGKLDLNADVNTYLDFEIPASYPQAITLYHLMSHTAGFEDKEQGVFSKDPADLLPLGDYLKSYIPKRVFPPGEIGAYSNYGTSLAGYIVERVSGEPFEVYIERHIFEPLGMAQSTFRQPLPASLATNMANGYTYKTGAFTVADFEIILPRPAGALSATSTDIAKFMIAHLQDGRYGDARILEEATAQEMHQQHLALDPRLSGMAHGFFEQTVNGRRILQHGGDTFLFQSGLYLIPEENTGIFVSYNSTGAPGNAVRSDLLTTFMDRYFPAAETPAPTPPADFAQRAGEYTGEYHIARANFTSPEKLLQLFQTLQVTAKPDNTLQVDAIGLVRTYVEIAPDTFQNVLDPDDRAVFYRDANGRVAGVQCEGLAAFNFLKAPLYASSSFNVVLLAGSALMCLATLIIWAIAAIKRRGKFEGEAWLPRAARLWATGFALFTLICIACFFIVLEDMDATYGVPEIFFGPTPAFTALNYLIVLLLILGSGTLVLTALAWLGVGNGRKAYWTTGTRVHYTIIAGTALMVFWLVNYWKILGGMG